MARWRTASSTGSSRRPRPRVFGMLARKVPGLGGSTSRGAWVICVAAMPDWKRDFITGSVGWEQRRVVGMLGPENRIGGGSFNGQRGRLS